MRACKLVNLLCKRGLEYTDCIHCRLTRCHKRTVITVSCVWLTRASIPLCCVKNGRISHIVLDLMVRLQFWRFRECRVHLHCYYSQIHCELDYLSLLGFCLWVKHLLEIICIRLEYLILYNCKLFLLKIVTWSYNCLLKSIINYLSKSNWWKLLFWNYRIIFIR